MTVYTIAIQYMTTQTAAARLADCNVPNLGEHEKIIREKICYKILKSDRANKKKARLLPGSGETDCTL